MNEVITDEQLERLGQCAEKADNLLHAANLPLRPELHVEGLRHGMAELHAALTDLYRELGGTEL